MNRIRQPPKRSSLLFVVGAPKTGTSTMVGLLNCHPDIFVMYSAFPDKKVHSHGSTIVKNFQIPQELRPRPAMPLPKLYNNVRQYIKMVGEQNGNDYDYKYFGDKIDRLKSREELDYFIGDIYWQNVIFMVRDIRTWLCHPFIIRTYKSNEDVVSIACLYTYFLIRACTLPFCIRVKMDDIFHHEKLLSNLQRFLGIPAAPMQNWWTKIGKYDDPAKTLHKWWDHHQSCLIKPVKQDIKVRINDLPFWDEILLIFNKYYNNSRTVFLTSEIKKDVDRLFQIKAKYKGIGMDKAYKSIQRYETLDGQ